MLKGGLSFCTFGGGGREGTFVGAFDQDDTRVNNVTRGAPLDLWGLLTQKVFQGWTLMRKTIIYKHN